jgi:hypothetical protein
MPEPAIAQPQVRSERRSITLRVPERRQGAEVAFGEALRFQAEGMVKSGPVVLPGNGSRQLDHLGVAEVRPQFHEYFVGDLDRSVGHGIGILENQPLQFREETTCPVVA